MTDMITLPRATVQQALEALVVAWQQNPHWQINEAIIALRSALAQQAEPDAAERRCGGPGCDGSCCQPVAEPKVGLSLDGTKWHGRIYASDFDGPEKAEPVAWRYKGMVGMPWSLSDDGYYVSCKRDQRYIVEPLYTTAPPQRKPLTEGEMHRLYRRAGLEAYYPRDGVVQYDYERRIGVFARAIERAHGIGGDDEQA